MNSELKQKIAHGFPEKYAHTQLAITISSSQFSLFEHGVFSDSMDEKWNIFVLGTMLYFARSWTDHCIFKVRFEHRDGQVYLSDLWVNRDDREFKSTDIDNDIRMVNQVIQIYLKRDDLYLDMKLQLPSIKRTIESGNYEDYLKSISSTNVGTIKNTYQNLTSVSYTTFYNVTGWVELQKNICNKPNDETLISLFVQHKVDRSGKTFYFDESGDVLLGGIAIKKII